MQTPAAKELELAIRVLLQAHSLLDVNGMQDGKHAPVALPISTTLRPLSVLPPGLLPQPVIDLPEAPVMSPSSPIAGVGEKGQDRLHAGRREPEGPALGGDANDLGCQSEEL